MNDAQHHMSLGNCKLKQQEDTIQHLLGENPKHWQHQMLAKDGEQHSLLMGIQNGAAILEDNLSVSYKLNILSAYDSEIMPLHIYPK